MCGIFGIIVRPQEEAWRAVVPAVVRDLFHLSESRGREAAGLAVLTPDAIRVYKDAVSPSVLVRTPTYRGLWAGLGPERTARGNGVHAGSIAAIGHSRLVTTGCEDLHENNQPVTTADSVAVHNGIICNDEQLRRRFPTLHCTGQVDTEVFVRLWELQLGCTGSPVAATQATFDLIEGTASVALWHRAGNALLLATNNGSLYTCTDAAQHMLLFASERYILRRLLERRYLRRRLARPSIVPCVAGTARLVCLDDWQTIPFDLKEQRATDSVPCRGADARRIEDVRANAPSRPSTARGAVTSDGRAAATAQVQALLDQGRALVPELRRCPRCILPETMPFIEFAADGACSYCHDYRPGAARGADALAEAVRPHRRDGRGPDCIVAISGGRDSSYALHYVKTVLGLHPLAYTYDWGMVTDLARRNIARICGKLGIEHILVSADIRRKRANIRRNVAAWLRRPALGTVPLFMAGDKQFFYHANRLRRQLGIELVIFSMNPLEHTRFKTGFCGVRPAAQRGRFWRLSKCDTVRLALYYAGQYALNPAYVNASLLDTLGAFWSYYCLPQDYVQFYDFVAWREPEITRTLIEQYGWERAGDTRTTWRIGDGTAAFYNYIYYIGAGFCENDTFRSNQVRAGLLERETALALVREENQPRRESLQWYCDTIGIDCAQAIRTINAMPKRYASR